jgi:hypothetical protein
MSQRLEYRTERRVKLHGTYVALSGVKRPHPQLIVDDMMVGQQQSSLAVGSASRITHQPTEKLKHSYKKPPVNGPRSSTGNDQVPRSAAMRIQS